MDKSLKIMVVEARFYDDLADMLLAGAKAEINAIGASADVFTVNGALEIPAALKAGLGRYDAFVALGCVVRGETTHYDTVSEESARGIMDLSLRYDMPVGNGILTVENKDQAVKRADPAQKDLGGKAVRAALSVYDIQQKMVQ